jgi:hypothetical protein
MTANKRMLNEIEMRDDWPKSLGRDPDDVRWEVEDAWS